MGCGVRVISCDQAGDIEFRLIGPGNVTPDEQQELDAHLKNCQKCGSKTSVARNLCIVDGKKANNRRDFSQV